MHRNYCSRIVEKCFFSDRSSSIAIKSNRMIFNSMSSEESKAVHAKFERGKPTIFDKIISKEIPANMLYENERVLAFHDVNPQAPTHFLVIPKKRIPMLDEVEEKDENLLGELIMVASRLGREKLPNGYRIVINNGKDGSQSIYHLHVHVLGGRQMKWPPG